jgi:Helix-turn-helix domain
LSLDEINDASMERRQAFQFELMPNGEQQRQMSRSAGCARYVYNKALALKKERYEKKEKLTRFQLDKMLVEWKRETPWLSEAPSHALQQAILDLDRARAYRACRNPSVHGGEDVKASPYSAESRLLARTSPGGNSRAGVTGPAAKRGLQFLGGLRFPKRARESAIFRAVERACRAQRRCCGDFRSVHD